jgi:serine/threonine-protein kinase HipA
MKVFLNDEHIGELSEDPMGYSFCYKKGWKRPISQSLPIREEPYRVEAMRFFGNLLPEEEVRDEMAKILKVDVKSDYEFFKAAGHDLAGALHFGEGESRKPELIQLKEAGFRRKRLSVKEILGNEKPKFSLAGAQSKLGVTYKDEKLYLPVGQPSTHILKIDGLKFPAVQNEIFCSNLAKRIGLDVPKVLPILKGENLFSLHERYDREKGKRIHQEDLLQALSREYGHKYEDRGGPGLKKLYEMVKSTSDEVTTDQDRFLDWVLFNFLIRNGDAHAKNLSLLYTDKGIRFAPLYDLICTSIFKEHIDTHLAITIAGEKDFNKVCEKHFKALALELKVGEKYVLSRLKEMANLIMDEISEVEGPWKGYCTAKKLTNKTVKVAKEIKKQAKRFI